MVHPVVTPFSKVYDLFFTMVTDDMYMEMTKEDTEKIVEKLLIAAIPWFEFPRVSLAYTPQTIADITTIGPDDETPEESEMVIPGHFDAELSDEELRILATYMIVQWLTQQIATVELVREKYSGSDFKFTSQANHIQKLLQLKKDYEREGFHLQRLYGRRKRDENGIYRSMMGKIMNTPGSWGVKL